jgi:hypothetical protein
LKTHYRFLQGYNQAKVHPLSCEQGEEHAGSSPTIVVTKNFKIKPKPTVGTGRVITKPKFTHSLVNKGTCMLDPHLQMGKKSNSKMNPKPTADTNTGITKPKFSVSLVSKRTRMLDPYS